ncbi:ATP-binding cassette domain-containing protein [Aerococcaceae bacterium DSM 111021]|uniref:ATP-binding cassette domain-containing protein n=1 Tax=Ruoffia tabacinasalis TaxID=87458 RepID=A0A5R9ENL2_9LACT|nr:ATP-binding cassette domain-containing protein [Ruoffia tabacinasalis]MBZ6527938.1 ATP-binding cassette domain-containing protein [Aerococcaceae bacterium DSM 111021]TLQ49098.1 ATP-binding cassette domain-containing protein [Ruoffia tabacinasalis]
MEQLIVKNVSQKFKDKELFSDVNLELSSGHIYGLVGDNGSGKTILMKSILGLIPLNTGEIWMDSDRIGKDIEFSLNTGFLIEIPSFILDYNQYQNLKLLSDINGKIEKQGILNAIESVGLDPNNKEKVRNFSLGMKQRLGVAQAIMENPELLILDEPMNSLDKSGVILIRELIMSLKQEGRIILITSHNSEDIDYLCDYVFEIKEGSIQQSF